tara:strand:- start:253 stop:525 length:273 start_codon:yes stop_codon:yes gene_type:complete
MKVTKNYLKRLIEEELKNMHEQSEEEGDVAATGQTLDTVDAATDVGPVPEPAASAEEMLKQVHRDLGQWLGDKGLSSDSGLDKPPTPTGL